MQQNKAPMQLNNIASNKPLLSMVSLVITMLTFIGIIGGSMVLAYFTTDFSSRELNVTYAVLLSYSVIDFIFPLLYIWMNKDYQTHTAQALKETIDSMNWKGVWLSLWRLHTKYDIEIWQEGMKMTVCVEKMTMQTLCLELNCVNKLWVLKAAVKIKHSDLNG